eukprot:10745935-Prorocentrum_lima.AAC.1
MVGLANWLEEDASKLELGMRLGCLTVLNYAMGTLISPDHMLNKYMVGQSDGALFGNLNTH